MTVTSTQSFQIFAGGQQTLTFNFRTLVSNPNYIMVNVVPLSGGTTIVLTYSTQYTVAVNSSGIGGTVTVSPTYSTGYQYVVFRQTGILQNSAYTDYNQFPANTLMNNLDQLTLIAQESSTTQGLTLQVPIGLPITVSTILPNPSGGTLLGWNPSGSALVNIIPSQQSSITGLISAGTNVTITGTGGGGSPYVISDSITVSSSTSDITIIPTSGAVILTSVNAATAGSNNILRLTSSGNISPQVTSGKNANLSGNQLGSWASMSSGTVYQAATDGFVTCYFNNVGGNEFYIITDSNPTPSTVRLFYNMGATAFAGVCPVRKNDYWQLTITSGTLVALYWLPMGS